MKKEINYVELSSEMSFQEMYEKIKDVFPYHEMRREYLVSNTVENRNISRDVACVIYDVAFNSWMKRDTNLSLECFIDSICSSIELKKIKLSEVLNMNSHEILDAVEYDGFNAYSTLSDTEVVKCSLDEILSQNMYDVDLNVVYDMSPSDAKRFVDMWVDKAKLPSIKIISESVGIDNSDNECFVEEFDSYEKALKWVSSGMECEEVEELFQQSQMQDFEFI